MGPAVTIAAALEQARALALYVLTDTATITRDGTITTDALGTETAATVTVWTGAALVQAEATQPAWADSAGTPADVSRYVAKLPLDVDVRPRDRILVTASLDPQQVGRRWRILHVPTQGWSVLRRCPVDLDVEAPGD